MPDPTTWTVVGSPTTGTSLALTGLTAGVSYDVEIVATNPYGTATSASFTFATVGLQLPSAPTGLLITAVTPTTATLAWNPSTSGTPPISYQMQYRQSGSTAWRTSGQPTSSLSGTIIGLASGLTYDFAVSAINSAGSTISAAQTVSTTTPLTPPSAPGTPTAWIITPTSVSLVWAASAGTNNTSPFYQIQYRQTGDSAWNSWATPTTALAGTVTGLTAGTNYDYRISASNSAGTSYSQVLTILAPRTGVSVTSAAFQPNQILTAEDLDAELDSKLDVTGGVVGPLTQSQTSSTVANPALIAMARTAGGVGDAPMLSGSYTAVFGDGPVTAQYSSIGMTLTVAGDSTGNGPAGSVWNILGALQVNALRSTQAGASGSQHAAVAAVVNKSAPTGGIPGGRRLADGWSIYAPAADNTGMPSSQAGAVGVLNGVAVANGRDDANLRVGARILFGEATGLASGGVPVEFSRGLVVGAGTTTAYSKVTVEVGGCYSTAALDLRGASAQSATITSASPTTAVTVVSVSNVLPFASAGSPAASVSATNPKAVTVNGNPYSVVAVSQTAGATGGTLTFSSAVAAVDAANGSTVSPTSAHAIWLSEGGAGAPPGDIALNRAGTSRIWYDSSGGGATVSTGTDRMSVGSTAAFRLPAGTSAQRPSTPLFGDLRANTDSYTPEYWQPQSGTWVAFGAGSTSTTGTGGSAPTAATGLLAGTPTTSAVPLSWTAPAGTGLTYQVQYRVSGTSAWLNWGAQQTSTSTTVSGLTAGTRYDFQVVTSNSYGSTASAVVSATTASVAPSAVTGLAASSVTSTTMIVSWTASASGTQPISYIVQYEAAGASAWTSTSAISGTSVTLTGLTAATSYTIQVVASNSAGSVTSSTISQATTSAATVAPSAPTSVAAGSPTANSIVVTFVAPASGTAPFSYQVSYRVTGTSSWTAFGPPVTATSVTVTGLTAASSYDFEVTATNSAGSSTSATVSAITAAAATASAGTVTGTQTSGANNPVISGPTSGAVTTSNVLNVSGITISDPPAATASGSCTLYLTCTNGTISTTVAGAQVTGSGGKSITYSNTLAACQTAAADLIYTAAAAAGSDTITIKLVDQQGQNSLITVSVTISVPQTTTNNGGAIPTDNTGTSASRAQGVLNKFGVGTHIDQPTYQNAGLSVVENCINYLGGVKILRDGAKDANVSTWWPQVAAATGTQFIAYIPMDNQANWDTDFNHVGAVSYQYLMAFEGCEEADTGALLGFSETLSQAATYQQTVYQGAQAYSFKCIQMSFGQGWDTNPNTGNYGTVGNLSAYADYANSHVAPGASPMTGGALANDINNIASLPTPGKPCAITEFSWSQNASSSWNSVSQTTAAVYCLEMIFDAYMLGCPLYLWKCLFDDDASNPRGLFNTDGTARPIATAIKNLFTLLSDSGSNSLTFTPGRLNYSIANLPPNNGGGVGGYQLLLQKSDGTFWLVLWNEQQLNNVSTGQDIAVSAVPITLSFGTTPTSITVYDPLNSTTPVQSASATSSVSISLPARPILVKIVHA